MNLGANQAKNEIGVLRYDEGNNEERPMISERKKRQMFSCSEFKGGFDKGFRPNSIEEHIIVHTDRPRLQRVLKVSDKRCEERKGSCEPDELLEIPQNRYHIKKVLRYRTTYKVLKEVILIWNALPPNFSTWMPVSDLERVK